MIISIAPGYDYSRLLVFRCEYPRPKHCVPVLLGQFPYKLVRFQRKEPIFRDAALAYGIDLANARYIVEHDGPRDLTKLLVSIPGSENYYKVGFFS